MVVAHSEYDLAALGQVSRDRADSEDGFHQSTNPWGWGGYTTQNLERRNLSVVIDKSPILVPCRLQLPSPRPAG